MSKNKLVVALAMVMALILVISACGGVASEETATDPTEETVNEAIYQQTEDATESEIQTEEPTDDETEEHTFDQSGYFPIQGEGVELPDLPVEWEEDEVEGEDVAEEPMETTEPPITEMTNPEPTENIGIEEAPDEGPKLPDSSFDGDF